MDRGLGRRVLAVFTALALVSLLGVTRASAVAATYKWSGLAGDGLWSSAGNWQSRVVPPAGSNLVFPDLGFGQTTQDDLAAGTKMATLTFTGFWHMTGAALTLSDVLTVSGDVQVNIANKVKFEGSETIVVDTACCPVTNNGLVLGPVTTVDGGPIHLTGPGTVTAGGNDSSFAGGWDVANGQLDPLTPQGLGTGPITVHGGGTVFLSGGRYASAFFLSGAGLLTYGDVKLSGPVQLSSSATMTTLFASLSLAGGLSGASRAQLTKAGIGSLIIPRGVTTAVPGGAIVAGGSLQVDGQFPSPVAVKSGGTLTGSGGSGAVTVMSSGTLSPGDSVPGTGRLTVASLAMSPGAVLAAGIGGMVAGTTYGQLAVAGSVQVAGTLAVSLLDGFVPTNGQTFRLINSLGPAAINGTFGGLPDGANLFVSGSTFTVTRLGGTGNDLVLTDVAAPQGLQVTGVSPAVIGQGASGVMVTITGAGFAPTDVVAFSGPGVTVTSTTYVNATTLTATASVTGNAGLNGQNPFVTDGAGAAAACSLCFTVTPRPGFSSQPLSPSTLRRSAVRQTVFVSGANFESGAKARFTGGGIKVVSVLFLSSGELQLSVTVSSSAALGARNLIVTNPDHGVGLCKSCLTVTA